MSISITAQPDIIGMFSTLQMSMMLQTSASADQIASTLEQCNKLQEALGWLRRRSASSGSSIDATRIRNAVEHHQSLDALFAADPYSLAGNLADAQQLAGYLQRGGLDVEATFRFPVLVRSVVDGKSTERLVWMSAEERAQLDRLPLSESAELPGCPTRRQSGKDGELTIYCCLDAYATLRLGGTSVPEVVDRASNALQGAGTALRHMVACLSSASSHNASALTEMQRLLKAVSKSLEKRLDKLHQERCELSLEYQQLLKDRKRLQANQADETKRVIERQIEQREARRERR